MITHGDLPYFLCVDSNFVKLVGGFNTTDKADFISLPGPIQCTNVLIEISGQVNAFPGDPVLYYQAVFIGLIPWCGHALVRQPCSIWREFRIFFVPGHSLGQIGGGTRIHLVQIDVGICAFSIINTR